MKKLTKTMVQCSFTSNARELNMNSLTTKKHIINRFVFPWKFIFNRKHNFLRFCSKYRLPRYLNRQAFLLNEVFSSFQINVKHFFVSCPYVQWNSHHVSWSLLSCLSDLIENYNHLIGFISFNNFILSW